MGLFKKNKEITFQVDGMTCGHCKMNVEKIANGYKGVSSAEVDLEKGTLNLQAKEGTDIEGLKEKIKKAGYKPK